LNFHIPVEINTTLKSLKSNGFDARLAQTIQEANRMILDIIPLSSSIGIGDSVTLRQIGIVDELIKRRNKVVNPFIREISQFAANKNQFISLCRQALNCNVFITGANAVTEDGKLISIDKTGNRVAGMI
jgi:L-lactate utilization protein LutB